MKKYIQLLIIFVCSFISLFSQDTFSKVKIWLLENSLQELKALNISTDHGSYKKDTWFICDLSQDEIDILENAAFNYEILIDDVSIFYAERNQINTAKKTNASSCSLNNFEVVTPQNYSGGSMGGFLTYQEMLNHLDSMQSKYPNLISAKTAIPGFTSIENRPIYWLRISNNPTVENNAKPRILYTALHHAREPASMQQLIYYMWWLLENYGVNNEITYLIDTEEMYFVPCVNPDGYLYNESTNPNGGGMHRKNRRNVGTSNKGVDLNRNYSYQYGPTGTSTNTNSDVYNGTGPFSEPEAQAMKWFTENYQPAITLNYHSYANELLFPWGYTVSSSCPDNELFLSLTEEMVKENGYWNHQSAELYEADGDSDDWAYGDESTKPKVFAMTPEVGDENDGFWPAASNILSICKENVYQNYVAAFALLDYYVLQDEAPYVLTENFSLPLSFKRLGMQANTYELNLSLVNGQLSSINNPITVSSLNFSESMPITFNGTIDLNSLSGNELQFVVSIASPTHTYYDTLYKYIGNVQTVFQQQDNVSNWSATGNWGLDNDAYSAPTSISDSPNGNYSNNTENILVSTNIDLSLADNAFIEFFAKWNIETNYDFAQLSASVVGTNIWTPLCGNYTSLGNSVQDENEPLYHGVQETWIQEHIDLSDFVGQTIQLQWRLKSDNFTTEDGFFFDDLKVIALQDSAVGIKDVGTFKFSIYPNPANDNLFVSLDELTPGINFTICNLLGQEILNKELTQKVNTISLTNLNDGIYLLSVYENGQMKATKSIQILH